MQFLRSSGVLVRTQTISTSEYKSEITLIHSESIQGEVREVVVRERIDDLGHYPLSFREEFEIAERELMAMTKEERIDLAKQAFGIWAEDAEGWKTKVTIDSKSIIEKQATICLYQHAVSS